MNRTTTLRFSHGLPWLSLVLVAAVINICVAPSVSASLIDMSEQVDWSDLAFPNIDTGGFDHITKTLTISTTEANSLELGGVYGPGLPDGRHYGTSGTLGGPFQSTLAVSGVIIEPDGTVTNGGSVTVTYNAPPASGGNLADDYSIAAGAILLQGTVTGVKLDPLGPGANTMNILFAISGGALQNINPAVGTNFAPVDLGMIHIAGLSLPSDFSATFSLVGTGETIDLFGIPEPSSCLLALAMGLTVVLRRNR
jgi:hypothetical protein